MSYILERDYGDMLADVIFELSKVFGEKTESVFCSYVYGARGKEEVKEETGIDITERQELILKLLRRAEDCRKEAKNILHEARYLLIGGWHAKD